MFEDLNIDFSNPRPFVLALVGGGIALFTASGGFRAGSFETPGGILMKIAVTVIGAAVGFFWGMKSSE